MTATPKAKAIPAGQIRKERQSRDLFTVIRHDKALGVVDIRWETGPEKGITTTYLEGWALTKTEMFLEGKPNG